MSGPSLLLRREGAIARIVLNRPQAGNALDLPLVHALLAAALQCDTDPGIRCVMLTGAGRLFCAGGDVGLFAASGEQRPAMLSELAGTLHAALVCLARMRKPLLTVVNGPAAGAGLSLAICGDVVLCARSAHFTAAYGALGLTPDGGMTWWLPRLVGLRRAQEIILSNRRIDANEAAAINLVTRTVDDDALEAEAHKTAAALDAAPVRALGASRALLMDSGHTSFETQLEREARSIVAAGGEHECREGIAAYAEKRKPDFVELDR